jgi:hypothetical protein
VNAMAVLAPPPPVLGAEPRERPPREKPIAEISMSGGGWMLSGMISIVPRRRCGADCDGDAVLTPSDLACFLQRFAAGDAWANCDGSTSEPALDVQDFACFLELYIAGCGG